MNNYKRLLRGLDGRSELHDKQYGFREGRFTVDAIQEVMKLARAAKEGDPKRYAILITLDVKNAFNTAPWIQIDNARKGISRE